MLHALGSNVDDWSHHAIEDHPPNELLRVQIRIDREVVLHMLEARENRSEDVLHTQAAGPTLHSEPD